MKQIGKKKRPPSVVLISPGGIAGGGGMGTVSRMIAEWFEENAENACHVLDARGEGSVYLSPLYSLRALIGLLHRRIGGASVLHLQVSERMSFPRKAVFLAVGKMLGMRVVVHHHGAEFIPIFVSARNWYRKVVRYVVRNADVNIVLGEAWRNCLVNEVGLGASRVETLYNAVADIKPQIDSLRAIGRRARGETRYLILANLSPRKGISEFIEALAKLHIEGRKVYATFAGGGEIERYRKEVADHGIAGICEFTGWIGRDQVLRALADSDVMVLPSYNEGMPISILEALCAGLPVIATPVGAIPELLSDKQDCLMVPPGDSAALAIAMKQMATDGVLVTRLIKNARSVYEQKFAVDHYMQKICNLYEGNRKAA